MLRYRFLGFFERFVDRLDLRVAVHVQTSLVEHLFHVVADLRLGVDAGLSVPIEFGGNVLGLLHPRNDHVVQPGSLRVGRRDRLFFEQLFVVGVQRHIWNASEDQKTPHGSGSVNIS